jgi:hypothetical protein
VPPPTHLLPSRTRLYVLCRHARALQSLRGALGLILARADFLGSKGIISLSPQRLATAAKWSVRAWAAYLALQVVHLYHDHVALEREVSSQKSLGASKQAEAAGPDDLAPAPSQAEAALAVRRDGLRDAIMRDAAYVPLALHWSVENPAVSHSFAHSSVGKKRSLPSGVLANEAWVGVFGSLAAWAQLQAGWKTTK